MNRLTIKKPELTISNGRAILAADIVLPDETRQLWFECAQEHADMLVSESSDSFLLASLLLAMTKGLDIVVEGGVSSRLYYNLTQYYMALLQEFLPHSKKIAIEAPVLHSHNWGGTGVITGFSGGIDSFCTYAEHSGSAVPPEYAITHLLFNDVGAHEEGHLERADVAREHFERMKKFAAEQGVPLIQMRSNIGDIIPVAFVDSHTIRNISVALLLQKACAKFLYSSAFHYRDATLKNADSIGCFDAMSVHLLSTETTECITSGGQHTRFGKTEIVADYAASYSHLDVCIRHDNTDKINCSRCSKCLRTQLSLEICGKLERYAAVFNLETYRRHRWLYLFYIWKDNNPLHREIRDAIAQRQYRIPCSAKLAARLAPGRLRDIIFYRGIELETVTPVRVLWSALTTGIRKRF